MKGLFSFGFFVFFAIFSEFMAHGATYEVLEGNTPCAILQSFRKSCAEWVIIAHMNPQLLTPVYRDGEMYVKLDPGTVLAVPDDWVPQEADTGVIQEIEDKKAEHAGPLRRHLILVGIYLLFVLLFLSYLFLQYSDGRKRRD